MVKLRHGADTHIPNNAKLKPMEQVVVLFCPIWHHVIILIFRFTYVHLYYQDNLHRIILNFEVFLYYRTKKLGLFAVFEKKKYQTQHSHVSCRQIRSVSRKVNKK